MVRVAADVAQLVEQVFRKHQVVGSSPTIGSLNRLRVFGGGSLSLPGPAGAPTTNGQGAFPRPVLDLRWTVPSGREV